MLRRFQVLTATALILSVGSFAWHKSQAQATTGVVKASQDLFGLPPLVEPADNPITKEKVELGEKLFNDTRFSSTGQVSCATCHNPKMGFADGVPRAVGINNLKGTRNSPTVLNSAFFKTQFWDGRSPDLEDQSQHPFVNPIEMGLVSHEPILEVIQKDPKYHEAFKKAFGIESEKVTMKHVTMAIGTFERTLIDANSRFDRWYFGGEKTLTEQEIRGFEVFRGNGRCVSCHAVEHTSALFTDHKFYNIGVGINHLPQAEIDRLSHEYLMAQYNSEEVDKRVLTDAKASELGRFAVTRRISDMGAFKTSTLRNIALTAPYMHDGSLKTLEEVVEHYNRGGASSEKERINPYLSGGIRPLNLTAREKSDLVAFLKTLTSAKYTTSKVNKKN